MTAGDVIHHHVTQSKPIDLNNHWAVIVDTSRYYYNYRHASNALSFYRSLRRLGFPDNQIILMLADDVSCNSRNPEPGRIINDRSTRLDLYGNDVEVDFRQEEVTVDNFLRLLTGRQTPWSPMTKRLLTDKHSNVFIYMTGHGGDQFLKFQDWEEISSQDIADALNQMHQQKRYKQLLLLTDTCQSGTLHEKLYSPNIIAAGCSKKGENSYSHHNDDSVGVAVIDRFTYYSLKFIEKLSIDSNATLNDFFDQFQFNQLLSNPDIRTDLFKESINNISLLSFISTGNHHETTVYFISTPMLTHLYTNHIEEFPLLFD